MAKRGKTLSQDQMYLLWDAIEDILAQVGSGNVSFSHVEVLPWQEQPIEELKKWSSILEEYMTQETKDEGSRFKNGDSIGWEDDDNEFNEYGLLIDSGCPDPVGFRD